VCLTSGACTAEKREVSYFCGESIEDSSQARNLASVGILNLEGPTKKPSKNPTYNNFSFKMLLNILRVITQ